VTQYDLGSSPVAATGQIQLTVVSRFVHFNADGKKVAVATGSAVILPGRPATVTTELTFPDLAGSEDDQERP
jgi:hypothetical protein